jgi:hypothetical protein
MIELCGTTAMRVKNQGYIRIYRQEEWITNTRGYPEGLEFLGLKILLIK